MYFISVFKIILQTKLNCQLSFVIHYFFAFHSTTSQNYQFYNNCSFSIPCVHYAILEPNAKSTIDLAKFTNSQLKICRKLFSSFEVMWSDWFNSFDLIRLSSNFHQIHLWKFVQIFHIFDNIYLIENLHNSPKRFSFNGQKAD